jgi:hypothetical protein
LEFTRTVPKLETEAVLTSPLDPPLLVGAAGWVGEAALLLEL